MTTSLIDPPTAREPRASRSLLKAAWHSTANIRILLIMTVLLVLIFGITQPIFLTPVNLINAMSAVAVLWFVSIGATFVVISGGIDLSSGAVAAASGVLLAQLVIAGVPSIVAIILAILFGALLAGITNGLLIGYLQLNVFVVTLATMTSITGAISLWTGTQSYYVSDPILSWIAVGSLGPIPVVIAFMVIVWLVLLVLQRRSYFGRAVYAVGGGPLAARLSGIRTTRVTALVYAVAGATAAMGGLVAVGRIGAATPIVDNTLPLQAIAAILLGGSTLAGGAGGLGGTALGVVFIGLLQNGLSISGVPSFWQQVLTGVVLVIAVLGDRLKGRRLRWRPRRERGGSVRASGGDPEGQPDHAGGQGAGDQPESAAASRLSTAHKSPEQSGRETHVAAPL
ncbi:MAG: ABC transporter permease [Leucobacter sp.]|nr:ABC transporter permease [Leucobacter sp.]